MFAEISRRHLEAIGVITVRWSWVDSVMYDILRGRLLLTAEAEDFRGMGAGTNRLKYFAARLKASNAPRHHKRAIKQATDKLLELYRDRNAIVHGQYGIMWEDDGDFSVSYSDLSKPLSDSRSQPAQVTVEHLMEHADAVYAAAKPLNDFLYPRRGASAGVDGPV